MTKQKLNEEENKQKEDCSNLSIGKKVAFAFLGIVVLSGTIVAGSVARELHKATRYEE